MFQRSVTKQGSRLCLISQLAQPNNSALLNLPRRITSQHNPQTNHYRQYQTTTWVSQQSPIHYSNTNNKQSQHDLANMIIRKQKQFLLLSPNHNNHHHNHSRRSLVTTTTQRRCFSNTQPQQQQQQHQPEIPPVPDVFKSDLPQAQIQREQAARAAKKQKHGKPEFIAEVIIPTTVEYSREPIVPKAPLVTTFRDKVLYGLLQASGWAFKLGVLGACGWFIQNCLEGSATIFYEGWQDGNYKDYAYLHDITDMYYRTFPEQIETDGIRPPLLPVDNDLTKTHFPKYSPTARIPLALPLYTPSLNPDTPGLEANVQNFQTLIIRQSAELIKLQARCTEAIPHVTKALALLDENEKIITSKLNPEQAQVTKLAYNYARETLYLMKECFADPEDKKKSQIGQIIYNYGRYDLSQPLPQVWSPYDYYHLPNVTDLVNPDKMTQILVQVASQTVESKRLLQTTRLAILFAQSLCNEQWVKTTPDYLKSFPNLIELFQHMEEVRLGPEKPVDSKIPSDYLTVTWPVRLDNYAPDGDNTSTTPRFKYAFDQVNSSPELRTTPCAVVLAWVPDAVANSNDALSQIQQALAKKATTNHKVGTTTSTQPVYDAFGRQNTSGLDETSVTLPSVLEIIDSQTLATLIPPQLFQKTLQKQHNYQDTDSIIILKPKITRNVGSKAPFLPLTAAATTIISKSFRGFKQMPVLDQEATKLVEKYIQTELKIAAPLLGANQSGREEELHRQQSRLLLPVKQEPKIRKKRPLEQQINPQLFKLQLTNPHSIPLIIRTISDDGYETRGAELGLASTTLLNQINQDKSSIESFLATLQPGEVLLISIEEGGQFVFDATAAYKKLESDIPLNQE